MEKLQKKYKDLLVTILGTICVGVPIFIIIEIGNYVTEDCDNSGAECLKEVFLSKKFPIFVIGTIIVSVLLQLSVFFVRPLANKYNISAERLILSILMILGFLAGLFYFIR